MLRGPNGDFRHYYTVWLSKTAARYELYTTGAFPAAVDDDLTVSLSALRFSTGKIPPFVDLARQAGSQATMNPRLQMSSL